MPSSAGTTRASRTVEGGFAGAVGGAEEIASWGRFCPAVVWSADEARNPAGVRAMGAADSAFSRAMDCSRRALALNLFSSCGVLVTILRLGGGGMYYSAAYLWGWWGNDL